MDHRISATIVFKDKFTSTSSKIRKETKGLGEDFEKTKKKAGSFESAFSKFKKITAAGFAFEAVRRTVVDAMTVYADFEQQMATTNSKMGASATETAKLETTIRDLAKTSRFSATETAKAADFLVMSGMDVNQTMDALPAVLNLATASGEDFANVTDIVSDGLSAFNMKAKDTGKFADILAATSTKSNTTIGMMGETMKHVGSVAGAMGYKIEDVALATGLMANRGVKASQAGTTLRNMITRLVKPTDESAAVMKKLGLKITDTNGQIKPFETLLGDLRSSFGNLTEKQKAQYAAQLFGQEAMSGGLAIVNASKEEYDKLKNSIDNSAGASENMADIQNDTVQGSIAGMKSALEELKISFGSTFGEETKALINDIAGLILKAAEAFNKFNEYKKEHLGGGGPQGLAYDSGKITKATDSDKKDIKNLNKDIKNTSVTDTVRNNVASTKTNTRPKGNKPKKVAKKALGSQYFTGQPTMINDGAGGESLQLPNGSKIIPHDVSVKAMQKSSGGNTFNININGSNLTAEEVINQMVPKLKLAMANM